MKSFEYSDVVYVGEATSHTYEVVGVAAGSEETDYFVKSLESGATFRYPSEALTLAAQETPSDATTAETDDTGDGVPATSAPVDASGGTAASDAGDGDVGTRSELPNDGTNDAGTPPVEPADDPSL